jgi:hypothetical protein
VQSGNYELRQAWYDAARRKDYQRLEILERDEEQREADAFKDHPRVKLIETCKPDEFQPSLIAFDHIVDSLSMK